MSQSDPMHAISAIDGRYQGKTKALAAICSEFGLMKFRTKVECRWVAFLGDLTEVAELPALSADDKQFLDSVINNFDEAAASRIKAFEATTNHDVKAVEYYLKQRFSERETLAPLSEWIHFACTSEDINNTAYGLMVKAATDEVLLPQMDAVIAEINALAVANAGRPMLSRTHGQTASPTTLGKELKNVAVRLQRQRGQLADVQILGKFNGAVGNFNAHLSAYPKVDWIHVSGEFIDSLGLTNNPWTTQIEPHDYLAELFHCVMRFNQILLDFDRDIWAYISNDYFKQRKVEGETGSSTMPHKINPIDFENSEGNVGMANAMLAHMADKLPVSRWQRDLSDSTVLRNIGSAFAHCAIAYQATVKGLSRLDVNGDVIAADLAQSWEVLAEPVQTVMRKYGIDEPYEKLKAATRGRRLSEALFAELLEELQLPEAAVAELRDLTPERYIGLAKALTEKSFAG
ncbi:MAG: adenylosuccinate lyase [Pseudomonadota bacterium]|nr:adenylosuccinate lyase [Pseudomonadota bacterium]